MANPSYVPRISADGRLVAFESDADDLVANDSNGLKDVFIHDRKTGKTELVSVATTGASGNNSSAEPSISSNGRYVAFSSWSNNLIASDTNVQQDVFVRDRKNGTTELVSVSAGGTQGNSSSLTPAVSGNGRYVAFHSLAITLTPGGTNGWPHVLLRDRKLNTVRIISVASTGAQGTQPSDRPSISADGRWVAFESLAPNLVAGDTNGAPDIFLHNWQTGVTRRASIATGGTQGNAPSHAARISGDGRRVAFESLATNLVAADGNSKPDVFVHNRQTGVTVRASVSGAGVEGNADSYLPWLNYDGRFVAFHSHATNLVPGDANGRPDVFVRDLAGGFTDLVSTSSAGDAGDNNAQGQSISDDGTFVALNARSGNLVTGDTNGEWDIFVAHYRSRLMWSGTSGYQDDGVSPNKGTPNTTKFKFKIKYRDPITLPPIRSRCLIDKLTCTGWKRIKNLPMTQASGAIGTGAIYVCSTTLPNEVLRYTFAFTDGTGLAIPGAPSAPHLGPRMIGPPKLCWTGQTGLTTDGVKPNSGPAGTKFTFRVLYRDAMGEAPTKRLLMVKRNGTLYLSKPMNPTAGGDHRLGKIYYRAQTISDTGTYEYRFLFQDGSGRATGAPAQWRAGPTISESSGALMVSGLSAAATDIGAQMTFTLSAPAAVTAVVVNVAGRPIRAIATDRPMESGMQTLLWDRRSADGLPAPPGLYLVRITARSEEGDQSSGIATLRVR